MHPTTLLAEIETRERTATRIHSAVGISILTVYAGFIAAAIFLMSGNTPAGTSAEASVGAAAIDATNSVTLTWTAPGDDGSTGQATSYDIRYSTATLNESAWGFSTAVAGEPAPKTAGQAESLLVSGLQPNTTYNFGIKSVDDAGNISVLSNIATKTTAPLSIPICVEDWRCGAWSACSNSTQTRTCSDQAACGGSSNRPALSRACTLNADGTTSIPSGLPADQNDIAPNTVITSAPTSQHTTPRYTFSWNGVDDVTAQNRLQYSYRIDSRSWSGWTLNNQVTIRDLSNGQHTFNVRARDASGNVDPTPATATFTVRLQGFIAVGVERGGQPRVRTYTTAGKLLKDILAYETGFRGGVQVTAADLGDDGSSEIVSASGPGRIGEVRIFRADGSRITSFQPYGNAYRDGLFVTVADVDGNGPMEIIVAKQKGTPNVRVFGYKGGRFTQVLKEFNGASTTHRTGLSLAAGDLNGDGKDEIITAPAGAGANTLRVFQLQTGNLRQIAQRTNALSGTGISLTTADLANDGSVEILAAPRSNAAPLLRTFNLRGTTLTQPRKDTLVFRTSERGGVRISSVDANADGKDDIVASYGALTQPRLTILNGVTFAKLKTLDVFSVRDRLVLSHGSGT